MSDLVNVYTNQIHDNLRPLYANWDIGAPRKIGDYGTLDGALFTAIGNITNDFGINIPAITDTRKDTRSFASQGSTDYSLTAQGQGPVSGVTVNAKLQLNFASANAMFFNAAGCVYSMAQSKFNLGKDVMAIKDGWDSSWVIITDIVDTGAVTAAISSSSNAAVTFEADASIPAIDLANPQLKLSVTSSRNCSFQLAAPQGKNILLGFCGIRGFFSPGFTPIKSVMLHPKLADRPEKPQQKSVRAASKAIQPSSGYFGQVP